MLEAIAEARSAQLDGEVPIGAVVVFGDEIKGRGRNSVITRNDPTAHAEILAIREAARLLGNYRLPGATLYSTIEPCAMCAGALVHARVERLVYGAADARAGAVDTHFGVCTTKFLNHKVIVEAGFLEEECRAMIQSFFRARRRPLCEDGGTSEPG